MVAAGSKVAQDVPPYAMVAGDRARLVGVNTVGLRAARLSHRATISAIKAPFARSFIGKLLRDDAIKEVLVQHGQLPEMRRLVDFITGSERGVVGRDRD